MHNAYLFAYLTATLSFWQTAPKYFIEIGEIDRLFMAKAKSIIYNANLINYGGSNATKTGSILVPFHPRDCFTYRKGIPHG
jgi:hypothetical protein